MSGSQDSLHDGTVTFLPHRLNRQPVVVRGLTADDFTVLHGKTHARGLRQNPAFQAFAVEERYEAILSPLQTPGKSDDGRETE